MSSPPSTRAGSPATSAVAVVRRATARGYGAVERFLQLEAASGILLLVMAVVALVWASSRWAGSYVALWHTPISLPPGARNVELSAAWLVNDVLMVVFFFVVGLEIRREVSHGELSHWRRAVLPVATAAFGMLVPAGLYWMVAGVPPTARGWGVPMATDIAFAVGVLMLLGSRIPRGLRVLLLGLAVIDDLGAIIVIAAFYSSGVAPLGLVAAALSLATIGILQRSGVRARLAYVAPALGLWGGIYAAGIHPTIAGVLLGLLTPTSSEAGEKSPADAWIELLHPYVAFVIMPLFALANAGVSLSLGALDADAWRVVSGVALGLIVGKPIGVLLATGAALACGVATLPRGVHFRHLLVLGSVAGIGFTMSLFVAQLAFIDERLLAAAKLGVVLASAASMVLGVTLGLLLLRPIRATDATPEASQPVSPSV